MTPHNTTMADTGAHTPILDGETATFVWNGAKPPKLMGDFNNWNPATALALERVTQGQWARALQLPRDAYMEYTYVRDGRRVRDPHNPRVTPNGIGHFNSFFYMPDGAPTPLAAPAKGVARGKVTRHALAGEATVLGGERQVRLYRPAIDQPVPLLVVYDGDDYYERGAITTIVDNLIAQKRIRPIALALLSNGGREGRMMEYGCSEMTLAFLRHFVLPFAAKRLKLLDVTRSPGAFGILGASMGGLMALYTGLRWPEVFGRVVSQSGAFELGDDVMVTTPLVTHGPVPPIRVWMDVGSMEWLLPANRRMHELLRGRGYDVTYREYNGGHNYPAWRDDLPRTLEALFDHV